MARYTIEGTTYASARDVVDMYGCSDYSYEDWAEIANATPDEIDMGNQLAFPELPDADRQELNDATREYAVQFIANAVDLNAPPAEDGRHA